MGYENTIISLFNGKTYTINKLIGTGGNGEVYSIKEKEANKVIKIEFIPNTSSLFCEQNIYFRLGESKYIPIFYGSGKINEHRCIIIEKLRNWRYNITFNILCRDIINCVCFLNDNSYNHGDIKPRNIMIRREYARDRYILVDYGNCTKYDIKNVIYKINKSYQCNVSTRYCSLDSHNGVKTLTYRSDMQNLLFCILEWDIHVLPWYLYTNKIDIKKSKEIFMNNPVNCSPSVKELAIYIAKMNYTDIPDKSYMKSLFR